MQCQMRYEGAQKKGKVNKTPGTISNQNSRKKKVIERCQKTKNAQKPQNMTVLGKIKKIISM